MAVPFQDRANDSHHWMSRAASWLMVSLACRWSVAWAVSSKRRRKIRPAGMTLQAKASLPISERSWRLVQVPWVAERLWKEESSTRSASSLSAGRRACPATESSSIPNTGRVVAGPSTFSGFTGAPSNLQRSSMSDRACTHTSDWGGPMKKKSSR